MNKYPPLKHAPLMEALIDIQIELADPDVFKVEDLAAFQRGFDSRLPNRSDLNQFNFGFQQQFGQLPVSLPSTPRKIGYQFFSGNQSVQCRFNGFTCSRLNGYDSWAVFEKDAREYWNRYSEIVQVARVTRVGLRFINKIGVPSDCMYSDYFRTTPAVPLTITTSISSFLMRLVLPQEDGAIAITTLATEPSQPDSTTSKVIFDIDVFLEKLNMQPDEQIWDAASKLRDIKNNIFFESITQRAKEAFE